MATFLVPVVVVFWRCGLEDEEEGRGRAIVKMTVLDAGLIKCKSRGIRSLPR